MNKLIFTFSLLGVFLSTNAQTISEIKSSSEHIDGRMSLSFYNQDSEQLKRIRSILKLNVFDYYELYERYDTDLKKKVFINSDEYRT